jgi:pyruvate/2-oxoglutarate dehydrogenase complex dihydrolipoamide acyltransferase (E2) component
MAIERKEPTLSSALDSQDNLGNKRAASHQRPPQSAVRPKVVVQKQPSGLLWFTFLLVLVTAGACGYGFWQLLSAQKIIDWQQGRIDELEKKFALSDDESTQSLTSLTANVRVIDKDLKLSLAEVDKLWAARNAVRKELADAQQQLDDSIAQVKKSQAGIEEKMAKSMAALQQRSSEQELLLQSLRERVSEQGQSLQTVAALSKQSAATAKDVSVLSQTVKAHNEAIDSFDKFRLTVNRDILSLKERPIVPTPK